MKLPGDAYVFDIWAWVYCNDITMLHSEIVANNAVDASTSVIEIVVGENNENGIFPLLAFDKDSITSKEL